MAPPHPFQQLSLEEAALAKEIVLSQHDGELVLVREIALAEPPKAEMLPFLELEHAGKVTVETPRPARIAFCRYDTISSKDKLPIFHEASVDLAKRMRVKHEVIGQEHHAPLMLAEFDHLIQSAKASPEFQAAIAEFELPEGFDVVIEPWPYGAPDDAENKRFFQGLIFAVDTRSQNPDANFYAFPLPLIPVMDAQTRQIIRIDRLATGGKGAHPDSQERTHAKKVLEHCRAAEYVPELIPGGTRKDLKPLNVLQPEGPSFGVTDDSLVEWQKWRFRVSFTPREGAVIHDVRYDGRSLFYRLSVSEMTVPYADARAPYHRKQAFDFGDSGAGPCCNNLGLGCDCLGVIKYFDGVLTSDNGEIKPAPNVICLHEQDNGIGWKHTNWRTGRAVVTRNRELVVQFILTLANYEYVFAYKFNQSGGIDIETRATGIVSCVNIDPGQTSDYGNVVGPGVLAQNHQHIFAFRIDPALDGQNNSVFTEESHAVPMNPETNPRGNFYSIERTPFEKAAWADADPMKNRVFKMVNETVTNPISGKPVGFKLVPPATQLLLADPNSVQALRAQFATHHFWVTEYRDDELYAGGRYTLQSRKDIGGVADAVARGDAVRNKDIVCWSVFGLTHNPRVEDWPVMPVEIHTVSLRPSDFFNANPSIDVPSNKNLTSQLVTNGGAVHCCNDVNGN